MLSQLFIKNFGLIEEAKLSFTAGLTVFTGETGAGKSMLIDAFSLALGTRGGKGFVHQGAKFATIEAVFELPEGHSALKQVEDLGIEAEDKTLFMRRQVMPDGQTRCFICGIRVNQSQMAEVGALLADIHGQRDQQFLLQPRYHSALLDQFGCEAKAVRAVEEVYDAWHAKHSYLQELRAKEANRAREVEILKAHIEELEAFAPQTGEEEALSEERHILMNAEKLLTTLTDVQALLEGPNPPAQTLGKAERLLSSCGQIPQLENVLEVFASAATLAADAEHTLAQFASSFEADPNRLEVLDERLHTLKALARKHACTADELPQKLEDLQTEFAAFEGVEEAIGTLEKEAKATRKIFEEACTVLTQQREKGAVRLATALQEELKHLKMPHAQFEARLEPLHPEDWGRHGAQKVAFFVRFNMGAGFEALEKAASGGEVSRLMLALKVVLFAPLEGQTLVFDEIDTGVGGAVADAMGKCLHALAKYHQVFAITHLPQVAAQGGAHMFIAKIADGSRTQTKVDALTKTAREDEIARMLSGSELTAAAKQAAKSLLNAKELG